MCLWLRVSLREGRAPGPGWVQPPSLWVPHPRYPPGCGALVFFESNTLTQCETFPGNKLET